MCAAPFIFHIKKWAPRNPLRLLIKYVYQQPFTFITKMIFYVCAECKYKSKCLTSDKASYRTVRRHIWEEYKVEMMTILPLKM